MNAGPVVSVIMIYFNAERFIGEALDSVLSQSYQHWELLLVDDGSTDRSTETALRFAEQYPARIRILAHDGHRNQGMSVSRNLGIQHAVGSFVAFLDADDVWLPNTLMLLVDILESHPVAAMAYGSSLEWHSWSGRGGGKSDRVHNFGISEPEQVFAPPGLFKLMIGPRHFSPNICSALIRREVVEEIGGFEDEFTGLYEDHVFFAKVFLNKEVYVTGECVNKYRHHPDSHCRRFERSEFRHPIDANAVHLGYYKWLKDYIEVLGVENEEIRRALRRRMLRHQFPLLRLLVKSGKRAVGF